MFKQHRLQRKDFCSLPSGSYFVAGELNICGRQVLKDFYNYNYKIKELSHCSCIFDCESHTVMLIKCETIISSEFCTTFRKTYSFIHIKYHFLDLGTEWKGTFLFTYIMNPLTNGTSSRKSTFFLEKAV
jgi:hypothetical protein